MRAPLLCFVLLACETTVIEDPKGTDATGTGASSASSSVSSSSSGSGAAGTGAGGAGTSAGGAGGTYPLPCEQRAEDACGGDALCVALYDWSGLVDGAPPPPPGVVIENQPPCCPDCRNEACIGCHTQEFKRCIPIDECGAPQPPEDCGVPESCP